MSLRASPIVMRANLPDGRTVGVRVGVPVDPYVSKSRRSTVTVELESDGEHLAAVNTILGPDQDDKARALVRQIVAGLESGALQPTAAGIEPLADSIPT